MYKFFRAVPRLKILFRLWLHFYEFNHLFFGKQIVSSIYWFIANPNPRHVTQRLNAALNKHVRCIQQIGIDVLGFNNFIFIVNYALLIVCKSIIFRFIQ